MLFSYSPVTKDNWRKLQRLNQLLFPIKYSAEYYKNLLENPHYFSKLAFSGNELVGAVCCRIEEIDGVQVVYMLTLGVIATYRNLGIAKKLYDAVIQTIIDWSKSNNCELPKIYLHVQEGNDAINFYQKIGFTISEKLENYYPARNMPNTAAFVLQKSLKDMY